MFASSSKKYLFVLCSQKSGKSFINIINNNGTKMLPCGIPLNTKLHSDNLPFNLTLCFQLHKKALIHFIVSLSIPYEASLLLPLPGEIIT